MTVKRLPHDDAQDDEQRLFDEAMQGVVPLERDQRGRARAVPSPQRTAQPSRTPPRRTRDIDPDQEDAAYVAPGVDRRELRKLRRGAYVPGRRLDLHGMTSRTAVSAVERFIESNRRAFRCVAIVHGRGLHSEGRVAVLRTEVRALLRAHPSVLAYADAPRDDGGHGAVYVLLRA